MLKELLVSDESLNSHGLRVRTSGIDLTRFNSNPIMLYNHIRVSEESKNPILPLGTWTNLRIEGKKLYGTPNFDTDGDKFAAKISKKFNNGTIRGASIGIVPLKVEELVDELGVKDIWVTRSMLMEMSIADIPSNKNAVVFYNQKDEPIELKAVINMAVNQTTKKVETMSKFLFVPAMLGLSADASDEAVRAKMTELANQSAEIVKLKADYDNLKKQVKEAKDAEIITLVDAAVEAKKIEATQREQYIKLAAADLESVKSILDGMGAKVEVKLSDIPKKKVDVGDGEKTFKELQKENPKALLALRSDDFEKFKAMYKADFGTEYKG